MTTAIRIRACHVGILGIAKIGTSNLRRIVLPFSHQALTPLRSPSAKQRVNQPFAGSPHSSVLPGSSAGIRNANRLVRPELPIDCVEFLRFTRSFVPESTLFTVYVRSFQLNRSAVIPPNHLWTSGRWPDQSIQYKGVCRYQSDSEFTAVHLPVLGRAVHALTQGGFSSPPRQRPDEDLPLHVSGEMADPGQDPGGALDPLWLMLDLAPGRSRH
jgi:hypothetical protein